MSLSDAFSILIVFFFVVWLIRHVLRQCRRGWLRIMGVFPHSIDFAVRDVPLSSEQWKRFCSLAQARGISQKRLLADCVMFYFAEKVK